jgi:uncharacterized protein YlzI (FlbEa/FlbD family)
LAVCDIKSYSFLLRTGNDSYKLDNKTIEDMTCLPSTSIKNIEIEQNGNKFDAEKCMRVISKYRRTIKSLTFINVKIPFDELETILTSVDNLQSLELRELILPSGSVGHVKLPSLKSFTVAFGWQLDDNFMIDKILEPFKSNTTIETFQITDGCQGGSGERRSNVVKNFMDTLPNIKHLKLKGLLSEKILLDKLQLESLHTESLFISICAGGRTLLLNQKNLKELRLENLHHLFGSEDIIRTVYDEMHLESFYLGGIPLILNHEPQHVEDTLKFNGASIIAALEILKRGRCK